MLLIAAIVLIVLAIAASVTLVLRGQRPVSPVVTSTVQPEATPARTTTLDNLRRFAETGDPVAQFALGARYAQGDEVKQDYSEAVRWFEKAANQGHVVAQATLGAYYWAGRGVPEDLTKAYFWSVLARAGGDEASKYRVAALTSRMTRLQVTQAQQQADEWLRQHQGTTNAHLQGSLPAK
jgi:TPR repeat protein